MNEPPKPRPRPLESSSYVLSPTPIYQRWKSGLDVAQRDPAVFELLEQKLLLDASSRDRIIRAELDTASLSGARINLCLCGAKTQNVRSVLQSQS